MDKSSQYNIEKFAEYLYEEEKKIDKYTELTESLESNIIIWE